MFDQPLVYGLDDRPPFGRLILYGLQWTLLTLPILTISTNLTADFLGYDGPYRVALGQRFFILIGLTMLCQGWLGHRLPLIDGPAGALLLCLAALAPYGEATVRGAMLAGGVALALTAHFNLLKRIEPLFTDNVVGTIVLLIAVTLMPFMLPLVLGRDSVHPAGQPVVAALALGVMFLIPVLSHWLSGFLKTLAVLLGLIAGTLAFAAAGRIEVSGLAEAPWLSLPLPWPAVRPTLSWAGVVSGALAYFIVLVNLIGSLAAVRAVVGGGGMADRIRRGSIVTGWAGAASGLMGVYGPVPYAYSPGVILATGVGSRWATVTAGGILLFLGFCQKLTALLSVVPGAVVAATLIAGMAAQVGSGIGILNNGGRTLTSRDYFIIGLPLLLGALSSILGSEFIDLLPAWLGPLAGNGLVVGLISLLLLEHVLLRD